MKVGLYTVSYSGLWYDGPALSMSDFIARAKERGFDGIEIGLKRPHASPIDLDEAACEGIRSELDRRGMALAACAGYNDFSSPVDEHREMQQYFVRGQIDLTKWLGGPVLRLFAAWPGVTRRDGIGTYDMVRRYLPEQFPYATALERWRFVRDGLRQAADYAEEQGVMLALQNHAPIITQYQHMLELIREVDSPNLKACLDCPLLRPRDGDADYVAQAVRDTGDLQVHSHFGGEFQGDAEGVAQLEGPTNYPAFVKALKEAGYDGWVCYEFCHPCLDARHEPAGMERVDEQVGMAAEYMKRVIAEA
jgi:sugar phosphate isomerase/epimerase